HRGGAAGHQIETFIVADVVAHCLTSHIVRPPLAAASNPPPSGRSSHVRRSAEKRNRGGAMIEIRPPAGMPIAAIPKKDGAPVPGSPGLQAISFNTSCEIEIARNVMQRAGQLREKAGWPRIRPVLRPFFSPPACGPPGPARSLGGRNLIKLRADR